MAASLLLLHLSVFLLALIHRNAWNWNSANFAFWGFSEVRTGPEPEGKAELRLGACDLPYVWLGACYANASQNFSVSGLLPNIWCIPDSKTTSPSAVSISLPASRITTPTPGTVR